MLNREIKFRTIWRNTLIDVFLGVFAHDPHKIKHTVKENPVNVLELVDTTFLLTMVKAEEHTSVQVIIHAFYVGVGMVIYNVFLFPEIRIASEEIQGIGHCRIHLWIA